MAELSEKFESEEFLRRVATENPSMLTQIRDFIRDIINRLKNVFSSDEAKKWQKAQEMWENAVENADVTKRTGNVKYKATENDSKKHNVIDLSDDSELSAAIGNKTKSEKYNVIRQYILDKLYNKNFVLSDGTNAIVDKSDAKHMAHGATKKRTAYISKIESVIKNAQKVAETNNVEHDKFDYFKYYEAFVKYGGEKFPIYVNVGRAINDKNFHIYDITEKIRGTAHRLNDVGRVYNDLRPENSPSINTTISQDKTDVNTYNTQKSESDAKYLSAVEKGDTKTAKRLVDEAAAKWGAMQNEDGTPKVMYHGSKKGGGFTEFKDWQYFTENKKYAERYAERDNSDSLYSTYLKVEKPFDTRDKSAAKYLSK